MVWLDGLPAGGAGGRAALRGGFLFGVLYFGALFYWVPVAIVGPVDPGSSVPAASGGSPAFTALAFALLAFGVIVVGLGAMAALFAWLLHHAARGVGAPLWLALPVTWTALEWSRAHLPGALALPWLGLGTSLTGFPRLVGIAELVGARGVTFWIASVNGLVAAALMGRGRRGLTAACAAVVVLVPMAWGVWRAETLETRSVARVAVVQPNREGRVKVGGAGARPGRGGLPDVEASALGRLASRLDGAGLDLVVLPEGAVRAFPERAADSADVAPVRAISRRLGAPVLFGGLGLPEAHRGGAEVLNSAFLMEPGGLTAFRYDKRRLVPVVERGYGAGRGRALLDVGAARYGVLICYESSYPEEGRALRLAGADVLVNVTNDAWFGGEAWYARTTALWQHPAHLVMRAVESRVGVVRSANTGISLFVDPVGRVTERTALFTEAVLAGEARTTDVITPYVRYGDLAGNVSVLAALGLLLHALWGGGGGGGRSGTGPSPGGKGQS